MRKKKAFFTPRKILVIGSLFGIAVLLTIINIFVSIVAAKEAESLTFPSADGVKITADIYLAYDTASSPFIVFFHQADWSRGEYRETARRFNQLGFNCLAVDLRSGNKVKGVENLTAKRAKELGKQTGFVDAMQDMIAALKFVKETFNPPRLLMFGSSHSAALALKLAGDHPGLANGVLAFSPAEYFTKHGMSHTWILDSAKKITMPVFITSAKKEESRWAALYNAVKSKSKMSYIPVTTGRHGSRALWKQYPDSEGYWITMETFLTNYFKAHSES